MPIAEGVRDRSLPWPKCVYRSVFDTEEKIVDVCMHPPAKLKYRLQAPATRTTNLQQLFSSFEVGYLPDSTICTICTYRKEE